MQGQLFQQQGYFIIYILSYFCFVNLRCENCNAKVAAISNRLHIPVFAYSLIKIVMRGQLGQHLVSLVICISFYFFDCKNNNVAAVALLSWLHISVYAFPLIKILMQGSYAKIWSGQLYVYIFFHIFPYKNCNIEAAISVAISVVSQANCMYIFLLF